MVISPRSTTAPTFPRICPRSVSPSLAKAGRPKSITGNHCVRITSRALPPCPPGSVAPLAAKATPKHSPLSWLIPRLSPSTRSKKSLAGVFECRRWCEDRGPEAPLTRGDTASGPRSRPSGLRYGLTGTGAGTGQTSDPEPVPEPEHLNQVPDGRDPRPEKYVPSQSSGLRFPFELSLLPPWPTVQLVNRPASLPHLSLRASGQLSL